jgi:hypothetical protein
MEHFIIMSLAAIGFFLLLRVLLRPSEGMGGNVESLRKIVDRDAQRDSLPEFCTGVPVAGFGQHALYSVAEENCQGGADRTFKASFGRKKNAWRDQSGRVVRKFRHSDRWRLADQGPRQ